MLQISGRKTYPTNGHLNMTTVRVTSADFRMNLVEAVYGWLAHDSKIVPHDTLYPDGKTEEQSTQENAEEFSQSQESAKVAALKELHIPVKSWVIVSTVVKGSPAQGRLHAGDVIKAVDGTAVKQPSDVAKLVTRHKPGQDVVFTVVPAKEQAAAEKAKRTRPARATSPSPRPRPPTAAPSGPSSGSPPAPTTPSRSPSTSSSPTWAGPVPV